MSDSEKAKSIFMSAIEQYSSDEWPAFLDKACSGDSELRVRVNELLRAHVDMGSIHTSEQAPTIVGAVPEQPGDIIGPYKLLQQIGEGGMGVVYMAEQKEPVKRRVALKIIKPGMDTRQVIARFEAERQALAMMDHPNIARVLDAGATESGRPYFVMELVNGLPVTKYCDEQHLTPKERLELFIPICQAVQHAHQKGIIHRDLKPSNILVALYDGRAVPKIIDFGVAKATCQTLTAKTMFTQLGQVVGTLEYMSPEQAERNQLDIDTRSDIYSLGVVLYELLTGETPFDRARLRSAAFDEMLRIIREEEPSKPSTKVSSSQSLPSIAANRRIEPTKLGSMIRGELDWIVLKAMEKDRGRRYETATSFANDIQHYLNDEAVSACPPSAAYKFRKFARRNKLAIGTTAAVVASLIAGIISTSWQAYIAEKERDRAVVAEGKALREAERATKAEQLAEERLKTVAEEKKRTEQQAAIVSAVSDFLRKDLLGMVDAQAQFEAEITPDPNITLRTILDRAATSIEGRFVDQPLVEATIHMTIGHAYYSIGAYQEAEKHSQKAFKLRQQELGQNHSQTLKSQHNLASAWFRQGKFAEAAQLNRETLQIRRRTLGDEHRDTLLSMHSLAMVYRNQGRHAEAEELDRKTLRIQIRMLGDEHPDTLYSLNSLALDYRQQQRHAEAEKLLRKILETRRRTLGDEHPDTIASMNNLAIVYIDRGRYAEAEELHHKTWEIKNRVLGPEHPTTLGSMCNLAVVYRNQGRYDEAEELQRKAWEIRSRTLGKEHPDTLTSMYNLANVYFDQSRFTEAERLYQEVWDTRRRTLGEEHPDTLDSMFCLANLYGEQGRYKDAERLHRKTLDIRRRTQGEEHLDTLASMTNLAVLYFNQERAVEAQACFRQILEIQMSVLGPKHDQTLSTMNRLVRVHEHLAHIHMKQKQWDEMHGHYEKAIQYAQRSVELSQELVKSESDSEAYQNALSRNIELLAGVCSNFAWRLSAAIDLTKKDAERAVELAREATELQPGKAYFWDILGVALFRADDWQSALDAFEKAQALGDSGNGPHRMVWAMACWKLGKHQSAVDHFIQAAEWGLQKPFVVEQYAFREEAIELFAGKQPDGIKLTIETLSRQVNEQTNALRRIRASLYAEQGAWDEAAADFAILLDKLPDSRSWSSARIRVCRELAYWPAVFDRLVASRPDDATLWIGRAQERALESRWKEAHAAYARAAPTSRYDNVLFEHAALLEMLDDRARYKKLCQTLFTDAEADSAEAAYIKSRTGCISPHSGVDPQQLVEWAKQSVAESRSAWKLHVLGLAHYRAGQLDEAIEVLSESNNGNWLPTAKAQNHLVLAMAHYSAGRYTEASEWLQRAQGMIDEARRLPDKRALRLAPPDWIALAVLRREAEALLSSYSHPQPLVAPRPEITEETSDVLVAEPAE